MQYCYLHSPYIFIFLIIIFIEQHKIKGPLYLINTNIDYKLFYEV